jgi:hypothetical protein
LTVDQVLKIGLDWAGFDACRRGRVSRDTNIKRFKSHFGSSPLVCTVIWDDLLTTEIPDARIGRTTCIDRFFLTLYFLKAYPTEEKLAGISKLGEKTARRWIWFIASKIQALKAVQVRLTMLYFKKSSCLSLPQKIVPCKQIVWPQQWGEVDRVHLDDTIVPNFLYSVDGVHFRTNEIMHPTLARNPKLYSHKFNQAGFAYELAISLTNNALVWTNGPFIASKHDATIFRLPGGLKEKTPVGKKGIADKGYRKEKEVLAVPNSHDTPALRDYKVRPPDVDMPPVAVILPQIS